MLQAIAKRKATSLFSQSEGSRIPREDIIFGDVFEILAYADASQLPLILQLLIPDAIPTEIAGSFVITNIEFWPRVTGEDETAEPDAIIDLSGGGKTCRLIVEAKWKDRGLDPGQAAKQWKLFKSERADENRHVFIVMHKSVVRDHFSTDKSAAGLPKPYVRTWIEIAHKLREYPKDPRTSMGRWTNATLAFLDFFNPVFVGFDQLLNNFDPEPIIFYKSSRHSGKEAKMATNSAQKAPLSDLSTKIRKTFDVANQVGIQLDALYSDIGQLLETTFEHTQWEASYNRLPGRSAGEWAQFGWIADFDFKEKRKGPGVPKSVGELSYIFDLGIPERSLSNYFSKSLLCVAWGGSGNKNFHIDFIDDLKRWDFSEWSSDERGQLFLYKGSKNNLTDLRNTCWIYFLPLTEIHDARAVKQFLTDPVLAIFQGNRKAAFRHVPALSYPPAK